MEVGRAGRLVVAALVAAAACGRGGGRSGGGPIAVVDDAGRAVRLERPARRIVSLVPSVTETVAALGAVDRLVARTRYDDDPRLADLPSLGGGLDPSIEALVALRPDLVVAWNAREDRGLLPRLEASGIPVYEAEVQDTSGIYATIRRFGTLLGRPEAARGAARALRDTLAAVAADAAGDERPSVLYLIAGDPPRTAGPGSFIGQAIGVAGGRTAFPELESDWPAVSLEAVVARDPDVIVLPRGPGLPDADELAASPGWRDLSAVREGRTVTIDADLFARPGPRLGRAARALQRALAGLRRGGGP